MPNSDSAPRPPRLGPAAGVMLACALWAAENVALTLLGTPDLKAAGLVAAYTGGRTLALGVLLAGLTAIAERLVPGRWRLPLLSAALALLGLAVVPEDLAGQMHDHVPFAPRVATWLGAVALAQVPVAATWFLGRFRRRLLHAAALGGAPVLWALNARILQGGYAGAHLMLGLAALAVAGTVLATLPLPRWWPRLRALAPWALTAGFAALALPAPPLNSVQLALLQFEGDVVSPYLARVASHSAGEASGLPPRWRPWFVRRDKTPDIPSTAAAFVPDAPIVILLTIDSLRADVLTDPKAPDRLPNLTALQASAVSFTEARAPGSQTVYTLSSLFMGTYFSQQYWTKHEGIRDLWPDDDPTPRFPELLAAAGIPTVHFPTTRWLLGPLGIVRGFTEETFIKPKRARYVVSEETFPRIFARLAAHGDDPLFLYTHLLDAHYTVSPRKPKAPDKTRYWANLELIDEQLGRLVSEIDRLGLSDRTILVVSSDHGEAFGEHGTRHHRSTLYEELLRVPLWVMAPRLEARVDPTPVSVIDLGPTILDIFGLPTPGHMMGQSLVPLLTSPGARLGRPIAAEGRLKKALIFPDGVKAVVDDRNHTEEVYDLTSDPTESINLVDAGSEDAIGRVAILRWFFQVHRIERSGYAVPFRP